MKNPIPQSKSDIRADMVEARERAEAILAVTPEDDPRYVVRIAGLLLRFSIDARTGAVTQPFPGGIGGATTFTQAQAERIAPTVKNKAGDVGEAVRFRTALQEVIETATSLIDLIDKAPTEQGA